MDVQMFLSSAFLWKINVMDNVRLVWLKFMHGASQDLSKFLHLREN
jgi:hypothetical protein